MICAVKDTQTKERFWAALSFKDTTATHCDLAAHFAAFHALPGSGWSFYTNGEQESPFALAVQGSHALLVGLADTEELDSFLTFLGVQRLKTDGIVPQGWNVQERPRRFVFTPDMPHFHRERSASVILDMMPSMAEVAAFFQQGETFAQASQDVLDAFYSEACTLRNHGLAQIWALRKQGKLVATAGAYAIWNNTAYLAGVETCAEERKQGYAGSLVAALTEHFIKQGIGVELLCKPGSEGFYRALGFTEQGTGAYCAPPPR